MEINSNDLLKDLRERTEKIISEAEGFQQMPVEELNFKPAVNSWSVLECLEHLNRYGDFYLPEIEKVIKKSKQEPKPIFKSGMLGNYFAKMMLPGEKLKKMKTFKDKDPGGSALDKATVARFLQQQHKTLQLLERSAGVDLTSAKTATSISRFIRLRLGDTFRVIIYHNVRHLQQAKKVLEIKNELGQRSSPLENPMAPLS